MRAVKALRRHARRSSGIVFDKAVMKDGREVPMQATIQAVAAGQSQAQSELGSAVARRRRVRRVARRGQRGRRLGRCARWPRRRRAVPSAVRRATPARPSAARRACRARPSAGPRAAPRPRRLTAAARARLLDGRRRRAQRVGPVAGRQPRRVRPRRLEHRVGGRGQRAGLGDHVCVAQRPSRRRHAALLVGSAGAAGR